jgi:hypothetical protein
MIKRIHTHTHARTHARTHAHTHTHKPITLCVRKLYRIMLIKIFKYNVIYINLIINIVIMLEKMCFIKNKK